MQINNPDSLCYLTVPEQMNVAFFSVHSQTNYRAGGLLQLVTSRPNDSWPHYTAPANDDQIMLLFVIQSADLRENTIENLTENAIIHVRSSETETIDHDAPIETSTDPQSPVELNLQLPKGQETAWDDYVTNNMSCESDQNNNESSSKNNSDPTYMSTTTVAAQRDGKKTMAEKTREKQSLGAKTLGKKTMQFQHKLPLHP